MEIGHVIWYVEGMKLAIVWAMGDIKVDIQEIGLHSLGFVQNIDRWRVI
jgi:hypothetical protein